MVHGLGAGADFLPGGYVLYTSLHGFVSSIRLRRSFVMFSIENYSQAYRPPPPLPLPQDAINEFD